MTTREQLQRFGVDGPALRRRAQANLGQPRVHFVDPAPGFGVPRPGPSPSEYPICHHGGAGGALTRELDEVTCLRCIEMLARLYPPQLELFDGPSRSELYGEPVRDG